MFDIMFDRKMLGTFSEIFGNLRKILENVQKVSYALQTTLWKTSLGGQNSSENRVRVFYWSRVTFYHCIAGSIFFMFRVQLESNLHLWVFFRSGSCSFQFFEKLTRANNSTPYDYLCIVCKQYYTWCMNFSPRVKQIHGLLTNSTNGEW